MSEPSLDLRFTFGAIRRFKERTGNDLMSIFETEGDDNESVGKQLMKRMTDDPELVVAMVVCGQKEKEVDEERVVQLVDGSTLFELADAISAGVRGEAPEPDASKSGDPEA